MLRQLMNPGFQRQEIGGVERADLLLSRQMKVPAHVKEILKVLATKIIFISESML